MIGKLSWFACLGRKNAIFCLYLEYIQSRTLFWNIFPYGGLFWTQFKPIKDGAFTKIVNMFYSLFIFAKTSLLDVWMGYEYTCLSLPYFCVLYCLKISCNICYYLTYSYLLLIITYSPKVSCKFAFQVLIFTDLSMEIFT